MPVGKGMKGLNYRQSVVAWPLGALLLTSGKILLRIRNSRGNNHHETSELCRLMV
jgi:hypothetical protein